MCGMRRTRRYSETSGIWPFLIFKFLGEMVLELLHTGGEATFTRPPDFPRK